MIWPKWFAGLTLSPVEGIDPTVGHGKCKAQTDPTLSGRCKIASGPDVES